MFAEVWELGAIEVNLRSDALLEMEEGDPRWREWRQTMPREELALMAETAPRVLDTRSMQPIVEDRERLVAALERVKAHRARRPD